MRYRRIAAAVVFADSLAVSGWLYLYRVPSVATFVDRRGYVFRQPYVVSVQPWWSVFAAVLALALGTLAAISLLQRQRTGTSARRARWGSMCCRWPT
jgi:hypothetical protein